MAYQNDSKHIKQGNDSSKNSNKVNVLFTIVKVCASHKKIQYNQRLN
jgi:hypothetical protein